MYVNDEVTVVRLQRPEAPDRSAYLGRRGRLYQRLAVPWQPTLGALWVVRFEDGTREVFAESELAPSRVEELRETWGRAPRVASSPIRRRLGAGLTSAYAVLAFLAFALSGILLVWAGVAQGQPALAAGGGVLLVVALGAVAVLVT